jgi:hypothetical protein
MTESNVRTLAGDGDAYRLVTGLPPLTAFGRAVGHLMTRPAFAGAPFGHIARGLAGVVNRGHYAFACRGEAIVGFVGWAFATEPVAEAWLAGERGFASAEAREGDCCLLNFWQADNPAVTRFLIAFLTATFPDKRRVYARRHYPNGRIRPLRLDLVARPGRSEPISADAL